MDCIAFREQFVAYLYGDLANEEQQLLRNHLQACTICTKELAELAMVYNLVEQSDVKIWLSNNEPKAKNLKPWLALAASWLLAVVLGWYLRGLSTMETQVAAEYSQHRKIMTLLARNQHYRHSLSQGQLLLIQQMERYLAKSVNIEKQVAQLHTLDQLQRAAKFSQAIALQRSFLQQYCKSPIGKVLRIHLAQNLVRTQNYSEAAQLYRRILQQTILAPQERGQYMWQLAQCIQNLGDNESYRNLLVELERESAYGIFRWRAVKALADDDFANLRFALSQERYRHYATSGREGVPQVQQRLSWMAAHQNDNFYPLILFIQAQKQGIDAHYGLRIILSTYPDSPLAFPAFNLYMQQLGNFTYYEKPREFPQKQTTELMLPYLQEIAQLVNLKEIAAFACYRQAQLLEKNGAILQALTIYRKVLGYQASGRLKELAQNNILRLQTKKISTSERKKI